MRKTTTLCCIVIAAVLQIVITMAIAPISFGIIQLRLGTIMYFLSRYNKKFIIAGILGNAIPSFFSPFGVINVVVSIIAALLATTCLTRIKNKHLAAVASAFGMTIPVSLMISVITLPEWNVAGWVVIALPILVSTFFVMAVIGQSIFKLIETKVPKLIKFIKNI